MKLVKTKIIKKEIYWTLVAENRNEAFLLAETIDDVEKLSKVSITDRVNTKYKDDNGLYLPHKIRYKYDRRNKENSQANSD